MRVLTVFALLSATVLAGCGGSDYGFVENPVAGACTDNELHETVLYLDDDRLVPILQIPGKTPANGFAEGFLNNDLREFLSDPLPAGVRIEGDVSLQYWAEFNGAAAPVVIGGDPGEAYYWFNQFGSDASFQDSYAVEYASPVTLPGTIVEYNEVFTMPKGGFVVEAGQKVRVLLTGLLGEAQPIATNVLTGIGHPSAIRFMARCFATHHWEEMQSIVVPIILPGNQGLLTGAIPATEGLNQATVSFKLLNATDRLRITVEQTGSNHPGKDDVDMQLLDAQGNLVYSEGSPYTNEQLLLWQPNLDAFVPRGATYQVRVNSYSGLDYVGKITIAMDEAAPMGNDHAAGEEHGH